MDVAGETVWMHDMLQRMGSQIDLFFRCAAEGGDLAKGYVSLCIRLDASCVRAQVT